MYKSKSNFGAGCPNWADWADLRFGFVHSTGIIEQNKMSIITRTPQRTSGGLQFEEKKLKRHLLHTVYCKCRPTQTIHIQHLPIIWDSSCFLKIWWTVTEITIRICFHSKWYRVVAGWLWFSNSPKCIFVTRIFLHMSLDKMGHLENGCKLQILRKNSSDLSFRKNRSREHEKNLCIK